MKNEKTSKSIASLAAKVLDGKITTRNITAAQLKTLAASALTQTSDKKKK